MISSMPYGNHLFIIKLEAYGEMGDYKMNAKECYEIVGGNYDEVVSRFPNEALVVRFARKFLEDPSYRSLMESLKEQDYETAFRAAHTLKGVCLNLGLGTLFQSSQQMTEALRSKQYDAVEGLKEQLVKDYLVTTKAIKEID